jgi:hypothetical protein
MKQMMCDKWRHINAEDLDLFYRTSDVDAAVKHIVDFHKRSPTRRGRTIQRDTGPVEPRK